MLGNRKSSGTIFHVLKEEHERLTEAVRIYGSTIEQLPKGAIRLKHVGGRDYLYLARRQKAKVVDEYIGVSDGEKARKILVQIEKRRRMRLLLKESKSSLADVTKVLRGKI